MSVMLKPTLIQNATTLAPLEVGLGSVLVAIILIGAWLGRRPEPADAEMFGTLLRRVNELRHHRKAKRFQTGTAIRGRAGRIAATRRNLHAEKEFFRR